MQFFFHLVSFAGKAHRCLSAGKRNVALQRYLLRGKSITAYRSATFSLRIHKSLLHGGRESLGVKLDSWDTMDRKKGKDFVMGVGREKKIAWVSVTIKKKLAGVPEHVCVQLTWLLTLKEMPPSKWSRAIKITQHLYKCCSHWLLPTPTGTRNARRHRSTGPYDGKWSSEYRKGTLSSPKDSNFFFFNHGFHT